MTLRFAACSVVAALTLSVGAGFARADKRKARDLYERGEKAYNLGRFREAITLFEEGYREESASAFLLNIAQAHRQLGDCERAAFFYKSYLANDPASKFRAEIEGRIRDMDAQCAAEKRLRDKPPEGTEPPARPATMTSTVGTTIARSPAAPPKQESVASPARGEFKAIVEGGLAVVSLGDVEVPVQPSARVSVTRSIVLGRSTRLEPGLSASMTPLPWTGHVAWLSTVDLTVVLAHDVTEVLGVRVAIDGGALVLSRLEENNPFTIDGAHTTGALLMPHARFGVGLDLRLTDAIRLCATPFAISLTRVSVRQEKPG
jgi:hypothetical protein